MSPTSSVLVYNHLWFKDQGMYLILAINTSITASMYVCLERVRLMLWDLSKKWLHLIFYIRIEGVLLNNCVH